MTSKGKEVENDAGVGDLCFTQAGAEPIPFHDMPSREWVLTASRVRVSGRLTGGGGGRIRLIHSFAGRTIDVVDLRPSEKEFAVDLNLRRGRNSLVFERRSNGGRDAPGITSATEGAGAASGFGMDLFFKGTIRNYCEYYVKIAVFFVILQTFVIKAFFIPTGSMEDSFMPGDYILVDRAGLLFAPPERGDVLVFQYPLNYTQDFVKRLIGLPGDVLWMKEKKLYLNGRLLDEPYVVHKDYRRFDYGPFRLRDNWGPIEVPAGYFFMMGDNRDFSKDSRFWGLLPAWRVKGRAWLRYYPLSRFRLIPRRGGT